MSVASPTSKTGIQSCRHAGHVLLPNNNATERTAPLGFIWLITSMGLMSIWQHSGADTAVPQCMMSPIGYLRGKLAWQQLATGGGHQMTALSAGNKTSS